MKQSRQALVIGLGQFGLALARALEENDVEVVAIDLQADRVALAAERTTEAVQLDAMDEEQLQRLAPASRDLAIVAIGDDSRESSIIVTALLRQMGAPRIIARATEPLHERILRLVGAHEVVNPERNFGERLAARLAYQGILGVLPIGEDLAVTEITAPPQLVGRSLRELELPRRFEVNIVAMRRRRGSGDSRLVMPRADELIEDGDVLLVISTPAAARALADRR
ncbi:MAG: TrkA family potassium uptake protein [Myxococcota bacterium]